MVPVPAFVAYPSRPKEIGQCIQRVAERLRSSTRIALNTWEQNDIAGRPLAAPIFEGIGSAALLIADVTTLNFNVTYEIGYAIGTGKRVYLIRHSGIDIDEGEVRKVGIFDTLGYEQYRDSDDLFRKLSYPIDTTPIPITPAPDKKAPLYLLETPVRTEGMGYIVSRVKKARIHYRSFAPSEHSRLAAMDAITHVANSFGVLVPLMNDYLKDSKIHNVRAAFVAGLAHGMRKLTTILQNGDDPVPLDVRDFVISWTHPRDLHDRIEDLASRILESLQSDDLLDLPTTGLLASLTFGDPMAENEFQTLGTYFLETDQYQRTLRGEVNLVVGRKGTGKTALFSQVRDRVRRDKQNVVVDLKPEGYQLRKLKEDVFGYLAQGAKEHLVVAFWEYLLYLEVAYKLLEKDKERHHRDHRLTEPYLRLAAAYHQESGDSTGDFSERLHELSDRISRHYLSAHGRSEGVHLSTGDVTGLIHRQDLRALSRQLSEYLSLKQSTWVLFDNLDRGWSPSGLTSDDILIVRSLIDAGRKIQRDMQKSSLDFHCVIFLRNDVYQLLMQETPDFGKEIRTSLDWTDPDLLRDLLRARLLANPRIPADIPFDRVWSEICVPLIDGTESAQFLIDRSLMRPRNLLKEIIHCRGSAINLRHDKILEEDIRKGLAVYSTDLLIEIDQELTQIHPRAAGLIYVFANERPECSRDDLEVLMDIKKIDAASVDSILTFLLYYGFLGIKVGQEDPKYIHDVNYDMKMLFSTIQKYAAALTYVVNPAFWPALSIKESG
jgi:hypothetical protein